MGESLCQRSEGRVVTGDMVCSPRNIRGLCRVSWTTSCGAGSSFVCMRDEEGAVRGGFLGMSKPFITDSAL